MTDFAQEYPAWLNDVIGAGVPDDVVAFTFNLFETGDTDGPYGVEFVGTSRFDLEDPDWACDEAWEPEGGRAVDIPAAFCGGDWEDCLARMQELVLSLMAEDTAIGRTLRSARGVGLGFVDGDLLTIPSA